MVGLVAAEGGVAEPGHPLEIQDTRLSIRFIVNKKGFVYIIILKKCFKHLFNVNVYL